MSSARLLPAAERSRDAGHVLGASTGNFSRILAQVNLLVHATWVSTGLRYLRMGLRAGSAHSGVPAVLIAAVALAVGLKFGRKLLHFSLQVLLFAAVLSLLGLIGVLRL
jgi:hypothetical protein